jgi:MFS family permease
MVCWRIFQVLGPVLGGYMTEHLGLPWAAFYLACIMLACSLPGLWPIEPALARHDSLASTISGSSLSDTDASDSADMVEMAKFMGPGVIIMISADTKSADDGPIFGDSSFSRASQ